MAAANVDRRIEENMLVVRLELYREIMRQGQIEFYMERYAESIPLFDRVHQIVVESQIEIHRGLHKGDVFYFRGVAELGNNQPVAALRDVLFAYVEDTLGTPVDFEDNADRTPAGRLLVDGFAIQLRLLREIKRVSRGIKQVRQTWLDAVDPQPILVEAGHSLNLTEADFLGLCERQNLALGPAALGFPQPRENRVFIGLNYDRNADLIPEMHLAIIMRNRTPVAVRDVVIPPGNNVHDVSLLLLHTCGSAVFDVTNPNGQFMEIERARDYGVNVMLVRAEPVGHPAHVSQMIADLHYPLFTYRDREELRQIIVDHLQ
jgi:hypothetical protein